jgi:hypothetical protein
MTGADRPLTKAEFIKEADAICSKGIAEKERAVGAGLKSGKPLKYATPAEIKQFVEVAAVKPYTGIVRRLADLDLPRGEKDAVALVQSYEKALKVVEANPVHAVAGNPFLKSDKAAEAYGIDSCML